MAFWDRAPNQEPEPAKQDPPAPEPDKIDRLTEAVASLAETQLRAAQPQPVQQAAPQLQPIPDISDAELERVYEEGSRADIRAAEDIRRRADTERLRRELGGELATFRAQGLGQLNQITKRSLLREDPYYSKDKQYKADVDALINQVESSGAMLTQESLEFIQHKVTGAHHKRLVEAEFEERTARKAREAASPPKGSNPGARGLPPDQLENYGLGQEAMNALQHLNHGRGRTPDEFAQELHPRKVTTYETNARGQQVQRQVTRRYTSFGDMLKDREWADKEFDRQRGIMTGEIDPRTPVTPRN